MAEEKLRLETRTAKIRQWALPAFLLGLIVIAVGGIALVVSQHVPRRRPYFVTAGASLALA